MFCDRSLVCEALGWMICFTGLERVSWNCLRNFPQGLFEIHVVYVLHYCGTVFVMLESGVDILETVFMDLELQEKGLALGNPPRLSAIQSNNIIARGNAQKLNHLLVIVMAERTTLSSVVHALDLGVFAHF